MTTATIPAHTASPDPAAVKAIRRFNRFYTSRIGVLDPYLGSDLSLTDVRVLYELAHRQTPVASEIGRDLRLDAGYLSRILRRFEAAGWLTREPHGRDGRQSVLRLTEAGHAAFAPLQQKSRDEAAALLSPLPPADRQQVVDAMARIERLLDPASAPARTRTIVLRDPLPGDMGWVVQQHGELYAREYGWNGEFEALVADIVAGFVRKFQPEWEKCWIAELGGERVGAIFVVRKSATSASNSLFHPYSRAYSSPCCCTTQPMSPGTGSRSTTVRVRAAGAEAGSSRRSMRAMASTTCWRSCGGNGESRAAASSRDFCCSGANAAWPASVRRSTLCRASRAWGWRVSQPSASKRRRMRLR